mmetsp:Transcript_9800/g.19255  ORF Transcript_9800/g.19255 Transcript_9800/m.19255 type:complete len:188 (+) Transcript_9800:2113-2676(+)
MAEEFEYYNVEKIKDRRFSPKKQKVFYLVKWENFPEEDNSWEPEENLETVMHLVKRFNAKWDKREQKRAQAKKDKLDRMAAAKKQKETLKAEAALLAHKASRSTYKQLETADMADDITNTPIEEPTANKTAPSEIPDAVKPPSPLDTEVPPEAPVLAAEPEPMDIVPEPPRKVNFTHMVLQPVEPQE